MANVKLVYINSLGGYTQPTAATDVVDTLGKLVLTGVSGVAIDAGAAKISNIGTPSASTDAATKGYVDSLAGGASWVAPVVAVATSYVNPGGPLTIDGVSLTGGERVLLTGQNNATPDTANGIYIVNPVGPWTRSSDTLQDGTAMFVQQGTTYHDTQWVLVTNGTITPGTTPIIFQQFGASFSYSAGNGLNLIGTTFSVKGDSAHGINVDASAGVQVKYDSTRSLSMDATAGLRVNTDANYGMVQDATAGLRVNLHSTGGLEFNGGAAQVKIVSTDRLTSSSSGLDVVGLPSQFKVNGTQVSTNVTATNLDALTGSGITALHGHEAVGMASLQTGSGVSVGDPLYFSNLGTVERAAAGSTATSGVFGVAAASAAATNVVTFKSQGHVSGLSGLTAGAPHYLGDSGGLVLYSSITSGNRAIRVGYAYSSTDLIVNVQDMGVKP